MRRQVHSSPNRSAPPQRAFLPLLSLTLIYLPITISLIPEFEDAVLGIVPFAASGTRHVPAPTRAAPVVVGRNRERRTATARNQVHHKALWTQVLLTCRSIATPRLLCACHIPLRISSVDEPLFSGQFGWG